MTITLRGQKGAALTYQELDGNFTDLAGQISSLPDSAQVEGIIDSAYIIARQSFAAGADSDDVRLVAQPMIDSSILATVNNAYVQARQTPQDFAYNSLTGRPTNLSSFTNDEGFTTYDSDNTIGLVDSSYIQQRTRIGLDDIDFGSNKITYANMYSNLVDLPNATTYHGMFAHVHATGKGYFAHGGNWIELANLSDIESIVDSAYIEAVIDSDYVSARSGGGGGIEFFTATGNVVKKGDGNVIVHLAGGGGSATSTANGHGGNSYGVGLFTNLTDGTTITVTQIGAGGVSAGGSPGTAGGTTIVTAGSQTISMSGGTAASGSTPGAARYSPSVSGGAIAFRGVTGQAYYSSVHITLFGHGKLSATYNSSSQSGYGIGGNGGQYQGSRSDGTDGCVLLIGV